MKYTICTVLLNSLFSLETCGPGNLEQDVHKVNCKDKSAKPRSCNSLSALQDRLPVLYGEEGTGDNMAKMLLPIYKGEQVRMLTMCEILNSCKSSWILKNLQGNSKNENTS